jgi:hypothetical protein
MSNVAKLKKEAADLEQKKQFDKALRVYVKLFAEFEKHPQEVDGALFNRVCDIQIKLGQVAEAVDTYEKASTTTPRAGSSTTRSPCATRFSGRRQGARPSTTSSGRSARRRDSRPTRARTTSSTPTGCRRPATRARHSAP